MTLCCLLDGPLGSDARMAIERMLSSASNATKIHLAETLCWATRTRGEPLWIQLETGVGPELRAAIEAGRERAARG